MTDYFSIAGPADRTRININDDWEHRWWCQELGCNATQLNAAVRAVGVDVDQVRKYLGSRREPAATRSSFLRRSMNFHLPTDVHFDDDANAFAFMAAINGKSVQCFISLPTVEFLLGTRSSLKERITAIERSNLVAIANGLSSRGYAQPIWITLEGLKVVDIAPPGGSTRPVAVHLLNR
jgi:hypothetical protein